MKFRWDASAQAYEITLGDGRTGRIVPETPSSATGKLVGADGAIISHARMLASAPREYTNWVFLPGAVKFASGYLAFGIPAPSGSVPTSGSASYSGEVLGAAKAPGYEYGVSGPALFQFNFGAGTLAGQMDLKLSGPMGEPDLPRYTFSGALTSAGATSFSGTFAINGPTPSWIRGQFTGPKAQELMAGLEAPFLNWTQWGTIEAVVVGKRD